MLMFKDEKTINISFFIRRRSVQRWGDSNRRTQASPETFGLI